MRLIDADKLIHSIDSAISLLEKMGRKNNYSLINLKKIVDEYGEDFDIAEHDAEIRRQVGDELLKRINDKEYGIEKNNLWLISQINNICYGVPRICDLIEIEQMKGVEQ